MKALYAAAKGFVGRVTEYVGVVLALFATYEAVIADRVAPTLTGGVWLCPEGGQEWHHPREVLFDFLRENADDVVYVDVYVTPVGLEGFHPSCAADGGWTGQESDVGLFARGPAQVFDDGSTGAEPNLIVRYDAFNVPQTARLTGQSGEEPLFGVKGLVYVEEGEVDMGFQDYAISAAPYAAAMLKKRDCAAAMVEAEGLIEKGRAYLFSCLAE